MRFLLISIVCIISLSSSTQDFGEFPRNEKQLLLNDLEILYQALDIYHSGKYWYTPKDSVDFAFDQAKKEINKDLNVLEFHKLIETNKQATTKDIAYDSICSSLSPRPALQGGLLYNPFSILNF